MLLSRDKAEKVDFEKDEHMFFDTKLIRPKFRETGGKSRMKFKVTLLNKD